MDAEAIIKEDPPVKNRWIFSVCQKIHFDRLAEGKGAVKTNNATPKCMWILERGALCSKSKRLAEQALLQSLILFTAQKSSSLYTREPVFPLS